MITDNGPKRTIDQLKLWYSHTTKIWNMCATVPTERNPHTGFMQYERERTVHKSLKLAMEFAQRNYAGIGGG